ncbi:hypothetical protein ACVWXO_000014 [Bradyrhizobium sp. LM2.7]
MIHRPAAVVGFLVPPYRMLIRPCHTRPELGENQDTGRSFEARTTCIFDHVTLCGAARTADGATYGSSFQALANKRSASEWE